MAIDWNSLFDLKVDELSDERLEALYEELIQVIFYSTFTLRVLLRCTSFK